MNLVSGLNVSILQGKAGAMKVGGMTMRQ